MATATELDTEQQTEQRADARPSEVTEPATAWWHGWSGPPAEQVSAGSSAWVLAYSSAPTTEPPEPVLEVWTGTRFVSHLPWRVSWDHPPTEDDVARHLSESANQ